MPCGAQTIQGVVQQVDGDHPVAALGQSVGEPSVAGAEVEDPQAAPRLRWPLIAATVARFSVTLGARMPVVRGLCRWKSNGVNGVRVLERDQDAFHECRVARGSNTPDVRVAAGAIAIGECLVVA